MKAVLERNGEKWGQVLYLNISGEIWGQVLYLNISGLHTFKTIGEGG